MGLSCRLSSLRFFSSLKGLRSVIGLKSSASISTFAGISPFATIAARRWSSIPLSYRSTDTVSSGTKPSNSSSGISSRSSGSTIGNSGFISPSVPNLISPQAVVARSVSAIIMIMEISFFISNSFSLAGIFLIWCFFTCGKLDYTKWLHLLQICLEIVV